RLRVRRTLGPCLCRDRRAAGRGVGRRRPVSEASSQQALLERIAALEARVARTEAHAEILALQSRYGTLADARYSRQGPRSQVEIDRAADALAALFTEDAVWEGGGALGRCEGRAAIRERFRAPTLHYAWHFFVKPEIR